jgi:DNA helicase HerA-like ATPase
VSLGSAHSIDGRTFSFTLPRTSPLVAGDLVAIVRSDGERLVGRVRERHADGGAGMLLAGVDGPFEGADLEPISPEEAGRVLGEPDLVVGDFSTAGNDVPASLNGDAFNRHTFLCGQSGSGKTYTLGAILERLLVGTSLPMVILDPNADFVGLGALRDDADGEVADRLRELSPGIRVHGIGRDDDRLALRFSDLTRDARAATMRLDPVADRDEFNALLRLRPPTRPDRDGLLASMRESGDPAHLALAARAENLGVLDWGIWAWGQASALDGLADPGRRATVFDLSGASGTAERGAAALAVVEHLWTHRHERRPTLIVIDEAHNVCSADPSDPVQALATERLIDIAAEGRKYGLWLLLSTQRPSKIHPQVLSQCDNLVVMRMNSPADLAQLADAFGFVPPGMLERASTFRKGEALVAGGFVPMPMIVRVGVRHTVEGGVDVPVPR